MCYIALQQCLKHYIIRYKIITFRIHRCNASSLFVPSFYFR